MAPRRFGQLAIAACTAMLALPASAAHWSRSFVVEYYEPAHYYGTKNPARDQPGTDCPHGINPDNDWVKMLTTPYRTREEAVAILAPERVDERTRGPDGYSVYYKRGPNRENIYDHPTASPDPGMLEVEGKIAYGFNLDGNEKTGFVSPTGEKGIDNAFYKASGCTLRFRGPPREIGTAKGSNDSMHDGAYTIVIVLSGEQGPTDDESATFGIYVSKDQMVKDANGGIARDYSFRVDPDPALQTVTTVRIRHGVIENKRQEKIQMRDFYAPGFFPKQLVLEQAKFKFELKSDGSLFGYLGGYRDWREHFRGSAGNGRPSAGAIHELVGHTNLQAWWYALRRNADGLPDPKTGEKRGISSVYAITAIPAFVITPDGGQSVELAQAFTE